MTFAEITRTLRKEKNLSQAELADALQVSKACISMIEIGKNEPTAITLTKYADFFQCSTDYLLGREDDFGNVTVVGGAEPLPPAERELLADFRQLPDELRRLAKTYLKKLVDLNKTSIPAQLAPAPKATVSPVAPVKKKKTGIFPA